MSHCQREPQGSRFLLKPIVCLQKTDKGHSQYVISRRPETYYKRALTLSLLTIKRILCFDWPITETGFPCQLPV